jgi:pSer/pThr/pTyr-binding forkhead associated (FHA) protein
MANGAEWFQRAAGLDPRTFVTRHAGYYLVTSEDPTQLPRPLVTTEVVGLTGQGAPLRDPSRYEVLQLPLALGPPTTIGRDDDCEIVLHHPSVSGRHAQIRQPGPGRLEICDRSSKNMTRLNGRLLLPERWEKLLAGDVVHFGNLPMVLLDAGMLYDLLT